MSEQPDETQPNETLGEQEQLAGPAPEPTPEEQEGEEAEQSGTPLEEDESQPAEPESHGISQGDAEKRIARMEKRTATWFRQAEEVLGEMALDMERCPRCLPFAPGYILPTNLAPLPDDQKLAVKLSIGELAPPDLKQDMDAMRCETCDGYGEVLTGSRKQSQERAQCLNCQGRGWIGPRLDKVRQQPAAEPIPVNGEAHAAPEPPPATDPWGRFQDDPLYGVMPGFERV